MKSKRYALVIGGGKIGYFLARDLDREGYRVSVMDRDPARCRLISDELDMIVYSGDGTDLDDMRAAGTKDADFVIAVTGDDEENLVACQIAKKSFGVGMTIARVSDPRNAALFERLGVDETICTTGMAIQMVENALPARGMRLLSVIGKSAAEINEFVIERDSPADGVAVSALGLPAACVLLAVMRGDEVTFPRGDTVIRFGDRVFGLAKVETVPAFRAALTGGR
ncbi:MAG: hypothetical protein A2Y38_11185 [Spirochaetes bacterium GWB1_59_5]|nr:MAG: hypothetical protein A2Y38_11185 [Spirochaetes bacterium GWB1_59_5]